MQAPSDIVGFEAWLIKQKDGWTEYRVEGKRGGNNIAVKLEGIVSRDMANAMRGCEIGICESALPALEDNEFYWRDLIGLRVVDVKDRLLGRINSLFETGANDVMIVDKDEAEYLIPYTKSVVKKVSLEEGVVIVDWDIDY